MGGVVRLTQMNSLPTEKMADGAVPNRCFFLRIFCCGSSSNGVAPEPITQAEESSKVASEVPSPPSQSFRNSNSESVDVDEPSCDAGSTVHRSSSGETAGLNCPKIGSNCDPPAERAGAAWCGDRVSKISKRSWQLNQVSWWSEEAIDSPTFSVDQLESSMDRGILKATLLRRRNAICEELEKETFHDHGLRLSTLREELTDADQAMTYS